MHSRVSFVLQNMPTDQHISATVELYHDYSYSYIMGQDLRMHYTVWECLNHVHEPATHNYCASLYNFVPMHKACYKVVQLTSGFSKLVTRFKK